MLRRFKRNGVVAMLAALALVLTTAAPAAANPEPYVGTIKSGLIEISQDGGQEPPIEVDLSDPTGDNPCELPEDPALVYFDIDHKTYPPKVTTEVTDVDFPKFTFVADNGRTYQIDIFWVQFGANDGWVNSYYTWKQNIHLFAFAWDLGIDPDPKKGECEKTNLACVFTVQLVLKGTFDHMSQSGTLSSKVADYDEIETGTCDLPLESQLDGETVTITDLVINLEPDV